MSTVQENEQRFEEMGFARVKILVSTSGLPQGMLSDAIQWVARREEEERQREIASEGKAKQIARDALVTARDTLITSRETLIITRGAQRAAWIAAVAAIAAVVVACLAWLFPRT